MQQRLQGAFAAAPQQGSDTGRWIRQWRAEHAAADAAAAPAGEDGAVAAGVRRLMRKLPRAGTLDATAAPKLPLAVLLSSFFINLLGLALPLVMLQVYDRIIPNGATATLLLLVLGMIGVVILDTAMKIARAYKVGWVTARHHYQLASEAVARLLYAPPSAIEKEAASVHLDRINALDTMREFYGGQSRLLLLDLPFIFIFLGLMGFIGGAIVFVPIVMFMVLGTVSVRRGLALRQVAQTRAEHDDRRYDFIIESLSGIETIKSMAMEPQIQRRFERLQRVGAQASHDTIMIGNEAQIGGNLFSNLTMISVVTVGALMVIGGSLSMGALAACALLSGRTIQPLLRGLGLWTQIQSVAVARERVDQLFELPEVPEMEVHSLPDCRGAVSVRKVSFAYGADRPLILKDVSLEVAAGEMIGLRGGDGSGKSTLIRLIRGELTPSGGDIRIDGYEPAGPQRAALCEIVSSVTENTGLFQGTILENLTMFRSGDIIDDARHAARLIGLEHDIHRLPEGYDTKVGDAIASALPEGLVQRIVIARALARKPKLLLFDEGNTALDARSDKLLRDGLEQLKGSTTIVLVSQRPSLLRLADRVYAIENGRLFEAVADYPGTAPAQPAEQAAS